MANRVISSVGAYTGYDAALSVDAAADYLLIQQTGGVYKKVNRNTLLGVSGTPADLSTAQTFTNKTLGITNIVTLRGDRFILQDVSDATKQAVFSMGGITSGQTRTYTLPNSTSTLVDLVTAQTLTNKTLTSPTISGGTISNTTISVNSISEFTAANGVTIDSLNIKDGKLNTNNSVVTANITDAAVTPAKLVAGTGSSWAWSTWSPTWTNVTTTGSTTAAYYIQIGKTVFWRLMFTFGAATAFTGEPRFTLPVTSLSAAYADSAQVGFGSAIDTGAAAYGIIAFYVNTTTVGLRTFGAAGTYINQVSLSATVPFAFASGDSVQLQGFYEVA